MGFLDQDEQSGPSNKGRGMFSQYDRPGTKKTGIVRAYREAQQTTQGNDQVPSQPKFFLPYGMTEKDPSTGRDRRWTVNVPEGKDYRPMTQFIVEVDTDERSAEIPHDDGVRFFYLNGGRGEKRTTTSEGAVVQAMIKAGAGDFTPGDRLTLWKTAAPSGGAHSWAAEYIKGSGAYHVKPRVDEEGNQVGGFGAMNASPASSAPAAAQGDPWAPPAQSDVPPF